MGEEHLYIHTYNTCNIPLETIKKEPFILNTRSSRPNHALSYRGPIMNIFSNIDLHIYILPYILPHGFNLTGLT
jgi:hypothetical protein